MIASSRKNQPFSFSGTNISAMNDTRKTVVKIAFFIPFIYICLCYTLRIYRLVTYPYCKGMNFI